MAGLVRRSRRFAVGAVVLSLQLSLPVAGLLPAAQAQAQSLSAAADGRADLASAVLARNGLSGARLGFHAIDMDSGAVVASNLAGEGFIPASVAKVETAIAALDVLGADHRFSTRALTTAAVDAQGRLTGDLILRGGGDPLLSPNDLMSLCRDLRQAGVREVAGRFLYDESRMPSASEIEATQPLTASYNPGVSALSLDFNLRVLGWRDEGRGEEAYLLPPTGRPGLRRDPAAVRAEFEAAGMGADGDAGLWRLPERLGRSGSIRLPEKNPGRLTAEVMREVCAMTGLLLPPPQEGGAPAGARALASHESEALPEVVAAMLEHSNNLVAELVGLAASEALGARPEDLAASAATLDAYLDRRYPGLGLEGAALVNHSGLSVDSRMTPQGLARLLQAVEGGAGPAGEMVSLLPLAGRSAGASGRFGGPESQLNVWAKTGTMYYASGLAGYLYTRAGERIAFAIFVNDLNARAAYDNGDPQAARGVSDWRARAKSAEEDLVEAWLALPPG